MSEEAAFDVNICNLLTIVVGTWLSWICKLLPLHKLKTVLYRYGRRVLYISGMVAMGLCFLIMGIVGSLPKSSGTAIGIGVLMIAISFAFGLTVAPVCTSVALRLSGLTLVGYTIVVEIPAANVRPQTVVLARASYVVSSIAFGQLYPRFINEKPDGWGLGGKAGYVFFPINIALAVYLWWRLPETIGRTFAEIDILFQAKVPARRFRSTKVDGAFNLLDGRVSKADEDQNSKPIVSKLMTLMRRKGYPVR
jgi:SP family general alpha glucoside:H+ symporter-like MFS transporter